MKKYLHKNLLATFSVLSLLGATNTMAQVEKEWYCDSTLRMDMIFAGNSDSQSIFLDKMKVSQGWHGRRVNMNTLPLMGNGVICVKDAESQDTLYVHSFSTLFQEWQTTEEATRVSKSFENTFLIPMPRKEVYVSIELKNIHNSTKSYFNYTINPLDNLIARHDSKKTLPHTYLHQSGDSKKKIDVVFVPDGYSAKEMKQFTKDCKESMKSIFAHTPFDKLKDRFNFIAVQVASEDSGVSIPQNGEWKNTCLGSHFNTFYSSRYLTTSNIQKLYDILDGIPCESIIILANTKEYGGGGIYNNYMLSSAQGRDYASVIVHEFGHSFAGLADEYYYDDQYVTMYPANIEPWEQNITTMVDFASKWQDMLPEGTQIPTIADGKEIYTKVGVYEGAGYQSKGVFRPVQDCRMKTNQAPGFCPVCQRAIGRLIEFLTHEN